MKVRVCVCQRCKWTERSTIEEVNGSAAEHQGTNTLTSFIQSTDFY